MERLRNRDEIDTARIESAALRRCNSIVDARMPLRISDLLFAGVGCDDMVKQFCKLDRSLTISGGTVPRQFCLRDDAGQKLKQLWGIMRPKPGIIY